MRTALGKLYREDASRRDHPIRKTYAAQCVPEIEDDKPVKKVLDACKPLVLDVIAETQPELIVSFGATALKQLGISDKFTSVRGRILEPEDTGLSAPLLVTFSERAVTAAPGIFETFLQDLRNGYARLRRGHSAAMALEELSKDYLFPTTIDEALEIIEMIGALPVSTAIAVDSETTSLRPEKEGAKIIAIPLSWGVGKATTILYDHPHADPAYLAQLDRLHAALKWLFALPHPKILHNAKFDLKWFELRYDFKLNNVIWCTLLGEHLLDEDKKGNYGLKALTTVWLPTYCGYEDRLHDVLEATDRDEFEVLDDKINVIDNLGDAYADYADALRQHKDDLEAYNQERSSWDAVNQQYLEACAAYHKARQDHATAVANWEALPKRPRKPKKPQEVTGEAYAAYLEELKAYDKWQGPPKPVKTFVRPVRPPKLDKRPKEPKDPRTKKEKFYTTDAGFENVPLADLQVYGSVDADVTRRMASIQLQRLNNEPRPADATQNPCQKLMRIHAIPASRILGEFEYYGVRIDQDYIPVLQENLTAVIDTMQAELSAMAPGVNLNSGPALARLLYEDGWTHPDGTKMPPVTCLLQTKKGAPSTAVAALKPYMLYDTVGKDKVPTKESLFLDRLFQYRKALKGRDTFLVNIRVLSSRDGILHTSLHINGTGTGRLSSSDMNLQNIPSKIAGFSIKKLFIPDSDDFLFVNFDYKGAEVRILTAYAKDAALIQALRDGLDMHSYVASRVFGRPYDDYQARDRIGGHITLEYSKILNTERTIIKRVVFGILYGAGPAKIAEQINATLEQGKEYIALLFTQFPGIPTYIEGVKYEVALNGYVETLTGRRRRLPLQATSRHRSRAERQACNFKIQSTSSDIVISQLCEMHEVIHSDMTWPEWGIHRPLHTYGVRLFLTVHDSICFQWPKEIIHALKPWATYYGETRVSEKFAWLPVPFAGDIEVGPSYGELQPLQAYLDNMLVESEDEGVFEEQEILNILREDAFTGTES